MQRLCDWVKGRSISVSYTYIYAKISGFMVSALVTVTTVTEKKFGYGFSSKLGPWFRLQLDEGNVWVAKSMPPDNILETK